MANNHFTHLIFTGACYIDTILAVPRFPKEDAKQRASDFSRRRGGNCPNTLEVLRQLLPFNSHSLTHAHDDDYSDSTVLGAARASPTDPLRLNLLTILPAVDSADVKFIDESLNRPSSPICLKSCSSQKPIPEPVYPAVDISNSFYRPLQSQAASSYVIKSLETSSRTIVNYNALDEMTLAEFQTAVTNILAADTISHQTDSTIRSIKRRIWFHFEGRIPDITEQCMTWLRRKFPRVSPSKTNMSDPAAVDIAISIELEHPSRPGLELLAAHADVVFYSRSWAEGWGRYGGITACLRGEAERVRVMHAFSTQTEQLDSHTGIDNIQHKSSIQSERAPRPRKVTLCCTWGDKGAGMVEMDTAPENVNGSLSDPRRGDISTSTSSEPRTSSTADPRSSHALDITERPAWHPPTGTATSKPIVDTVGAGDTWTAGMLFTFLSPDPAIAKWGLARRVDFANEVAGRKILREGFGGLGEEMLEQLRGECGGE